MLDDFDISTYVDPTQAAAPDFVVFDLTDFQLRSLAEHINPDFHFPSELSI